MGSRARAALDEAIEKGDGRANMLLLFGGLLRGVLLARPKATTSGVGCDPCPGLPRCCALALLLL